MYVLYQVGDLPLYSALVGVSGDALEIEFSYSWRAPATTFQSQGGARYALPMTYALEDPVEMEVSGGLRATTYMTPTQIKRRVRSFAGRRNLPVIVANIEEDHTGCPVRLTWLIGYGVLTEDENNISYADDESAAPFATQEISWTVTLTEPLQQLQRAFWEYRHVTERSMNNYSNFVGPSSGNSFYHPLYLREINPDYYFVRWQEPDTMLNPQFWGLAYLNEMTLGGVGSDFAEPETLALYSSEDLWSLPPRAVYAFTNLTPYGEVRIESRLKTGLYYGEEVDSVATLDLVQLNTDLAAAGYGGVHVEDIVYTGDIYPRPGFIMRNGNELTGVRPRWLYSNLYPGQIAIGYVTIDFIKYLNDAMVAYLITYGMT